MKKISDRQTHKPRKRKAVWYGWHPGPIMKVLEWKDTACGFSVLRSGWTLIGDKKVLSIDRHIKITVEEV